MRLGATTSRVVEPAVAKGQRVNSSTAAGGRSPPPAASRPFFRVQTRQTHAAGGLAEVICIN